ncbi:Ribokinase-like protein [Wallemia mellicola]|nr:Ribokinase-like protein [Wallemia mellicola]
MALVFGSINVDEFFSVPHIVRPGETLASTKITKKAGGKGANQAVALAKASAVVSLAGQIGEDGEWIRTLLHSFNVDTSLLKTNNSLPSGRATIQISSEGENSIVLFGGTNMLSYSDALPLSKYQFLLLQEEIGLKTIYNPSPMPNATQLRNFPWSSLSYLIINAGEAADLLKAFGEDPTSLSSAELLDKLMSNPSTGSLEGLIITLGENGLIARIKIEGIQTNYELPTIKVNAIDSTGAGDTFAGYFTACRMKMQTVDTSTMELALRNAMGAAALAVTKSGAMEAIPEVNETAILISIYTFTFSSFTLSCFYIFECVVAPFERSRSSPLDLWNESEYANRNWYDDSRIPQWLSLRT